jgi:hypothetical protein
MIGILLPVPPSDVSGKAQAVSTLRSVGCIDIAAAHFRLDPPRNLNL